MTCKNHIYHIPRHRLAVTRSPTLNCLSSGFFGAGKRRTVPFTRCITQVQNSYGERVASVTRITSRVVRHLDMIADSRRQEQFRGCSSGNRSRATLLTPANPPQIARDDCGPSQDLPSRTFNHFSHFAVSSFFDQCTGGENFGELPPE